MFSHSLLSSHYHFIPSTDDHQQLFIITLFFPMAQTHNHPFKIYNVNHQFQNEYKK